MQNISGVLENTLTVIRSPNTLCIKISYKAIADHDFWSAQELAFENTVVLEMNSNRKLGSEALH